MTITTSIYYRGFSMAFYISNHYTVRETMADTVGSCLTSAAEGGGDVAPASAGGGSRVVVKMEPDPVIASIPKSVISAAVALCWRSHRKLFVRSSIPPSPFCYDHRTSQCGPLRWLF